MSFSEYELHQLKVMDKVINNTINQTNSDTMKIDGKESNILYETNEDALNGLKKGDFYKSIKDDIYHPILLREFNKKIDAAINKEGEIKGIKNKKNKKNKKRKKEKRKIRKAMLKAEVEAKEKAEVEARDKAKAEARAKAREQTKQGIEAITNKKQKVPEEKAEDDSEEDEIILIKKRLPVFETLSLGKSVPDPPPGFTGGRKTRRRRKKKGKRKTKRRRKTKRKRKKKKRKTKRRR